MTLVCHGEVQYPLPNKGNEVIIRPRPPKQPAPPKSAILQIQADSATTEQQAAAADIAGTWKGYSVRRKLASEELYAEHCRRHAMVIQCFVRKWQARARFLALRAARDEQITHTVQTYNHTRLLEIRPAANWQKRQFEQAARVIQAVYKWYREKRDAEQRGDDKNEVPYPLRTRRKSALLPYRRKTLLYRSRCVGRGSADHSLVGTPHTGSPLAPQRPPPSSAPAGARRPSRSGKDTSLAISSTSLPGAPHMGDISHMPRASSVSDNRQPQQSKMAAGGSGALTVRHPTSSSNELALVPMQAFGSPPSSSSKFRGPPTQDEVEDTNANMRRREQAVRELLASPPQKERIKRKRHGIEEKDFDHCAAILQRRFRTVLAKQEVHSRLCRTEYFDRYATIMQCAFRTFLAKRRAAHLRRKVHGEAYLATRRYELQQVDTISEEHSWNAHVMNAAARILQTAFRRFYARKTWKEGKTSAHKNVDEYLASSQAPPALPLGLLKDCPPHKKTAMISRTDNSAIQRKPTFRRHYSRQGTKVQSQAAEGQGTRAEEENDVNAASEQEQQQQPIESDAAGRRSFTDEERDAAALKIQSAFRQHEARMVVERKRVERRAAFEQANLTEAARTIQAAHRRKHNNLQNATTPPTGSTPSSSSSVTPAATALASAKPATTPTTMVTVAATGGVTVSASSSNSSPQQPAPPTTSNTQDPAPHHDAAPAHASEMITMTEDEKEHLQDLMDEAMADRPSPQTGAGGEPSPVAEGGDPYEEL